METYTDFKEAKNMTTATQERLEHDSESTPRSAHQIAVKLAELTLKNDANSTQTDENPEDSQVCRVTKIKLTKERIRVDYQKQFGNEWYDFSCSGAIHNMLGDFNKSLAMLKPVISEICEADESWDLDTLAVIGLSISYDSNDCMGANITALKKLECANSPLVINTPHLKEPAEEQVPGEYKEDDWQLIEECMDEAKKYARGERRCKQLSMV